jgi:(p)ppGpp synthase/HD superfamily hydrolase
MPETVPKVIELPSPCPKETECNSFLHQLGLKITTKNRMRILQACREARLLHVRGDKDNVYCDDPQAVVMILLQELNIYRADILQATFLHNALEGDQVDYYYLKTTFGKEVADMVGVLTVPKPRNGIGGITIIRGLDDHTPVDTLADKIRKSSVEVMIIKLCERLRRLRELSRIFSTESSEAINEARMCYLPMIEVVRAGYPDIGEKLSNLFAEAMTNMEQ